MKFEYQLNNTEYTLPETLPITDLRLQPAVALLWGKLNGLDITDRNELMKAWNADGMAERYRDFVEYAGVTQEVNWRDEESLQKIFELILISNDNHSEQ